MKHHTYTSIETSRQKIVMLTALLFILLAATIAAFYLIPDHTQATPASPAMDLLSPQEFNHLSLGAVIAGALTAFLLQMAFNLIGISFNVLKPGTTAIKERSPRPLFNFRAATWLILSTLIAAFIGGQITVYAANLPSMLDSLLHSGLVWTLSLLVTAVSVFIYTEMPQAVAFLTVPNRHYSR